MTKKERQIYKSGRKNENAYRFDKLTRKQRKVFLILIVTLFFSCLLIIFNTFNIASNSDVKRYIGAIDGVDPQDSDFAIYYLDVGQGDCTIIKCNNKVMMIDCSTLNQINTIRQSIMTLEIDTIDFMVITHQHDDHMGSATKILNDVNVNNFIMPRLAQSNNVTSKSYNVLINTLDIKKVNKIPAQDCKSFMLGDALVEILSPTVQSNNINNMSIVLKVTYGENEFLFQGDAESKIENDLIRSDYDIDVDVLRIGHHGSKTSTSENFLLATSPAIALISSGADNSYKHPNGKILNVLENNNVKTFCTAFNGDITITSNGKTIMIYTQNSNKIYQYK